ncbi:phosphoribosyltransferase family protein [Sutcliffiella cohnii]
MLVKTNDIKCLLISTATLDFDEVNLIRESSNNLEIVFLIPYNQKEPDYLYPNDLRIKEEWIDEIIGYGSLIKKVVTMIGKPSSNILFISKDMSYIRRCLNYPIGTILISNGELGYDDIGKLPDVKLKSFKQLFSSLSRNLGYFAEVISTIVRKDVAFKDSGFVFNFKLERLETKVEVVAAGRYFPSKHESFNSHQLSHRINKSKFEDTQDKMFVTIFTKIIEYINKKSKVDGITRVPSRPGKRDRLKPIVREIVKHIPVNDESDNLVCPHDYPSHKELKKDMRFENVKNVFMVNGDHKDKHIVLIDDVLTTGATVLECAKELYKAGAKKVTIVVLGVNQFYDELTQRYSTCPKCGGKMILRINSNNNTAFYGCENYRDPLCGGFTERYLPGLNKIIEENCIKNEDTDEIVEIDF